MITFLHNELLVQQIGWTLLHTLWQGVAIALLLAVMLRAMRGASSNARYLVACGAMLMLVSCAIVTFALLARPAVAVAVVPRGVRVSQPDVAVAPPTDTVDLDRPLAVVQQESDALHYIVTIWMTGVVAIAIWHLGGWLLLVRLRRGEPVARLRDVVDRLAMQIGITRPVRLLESARIDVPAVLGVLRPVILLPVALLNDLAPQQVEAILAHELAHIRRHDFLINLIQSAIETLLFYHPATWWISARIRRERENCCDDIATSNCGDRAYAAALAALEQRRLPSVVSHLAPAATGTTGGDLLDRVRRVLKLPPLRRRISRTRSLAAAALAVACVVLPLVVRADDKRAAATKPATSPVIKVVVAKDGLLHDGKPMDIAALKRLLGDIPESQRRQTVLEVAAASPDVTVERFFTATAAMHQIVAEQKLAYLSQTGIQPQPAPAPATTRAARDAGGEYYMTGRIGGRGGVYALPPSRITLKQAIAAAGGPTGEPAAGLLVSVDRRDGDAARYIMQNVPLAQVLNAKPELAMQSDDVVRITDKPLDVKAEAAANAAIIPVDADAKEVGEYYMTGIVQRVGVYSLTKRKITLKQAIAAAGGFDDGKADALLTVIRRSGPDRQSRPIENARYSEILSGAQRDAYLQSNDVVEVRDAPPAEGPATASAPAPSTQPGAALPVEPAAPSSADPRLLQLLHQRNLYALQIETLSTSLGREHPTMKSARAMAEKLDRSIEQYRRAAATAPLEQIANTDATLREYLKQLETMEFDLERLKRNIGPKSRVYIDAAADLELQKQRIAAYAEAYRRRSSDADSMTDTRHSVIPLQPTTATKP